MFFSKIVQNLHKVIAKFKIQKGEEITAAYGKTYAKWLRSSIKEKAGNWDETIAQQEKIEAQKFKDSIQVATR